MIRVVNLFKMWRMIIMMVFNVNFIFSQNFISLFWGLFNDETNLRVTTNIIREEEQWMPKKNLNYYFQFIKNIFTKLHHNKKTNKKTTFDKLHNNHKTNQKNEKWNTMQVGPKLSSLVMYSKCFEEAMWRSHGGHPFNPKIQLLWMFFSRKLLEEAS
jgi:hypothetical protein